MNPVMLAVLIAIPAAVVAASSYFCRRFVRGGGSAKKATFAHIAAAFLAGILVCSLALAVSAEGDAPAAADAAADTGTAGGFAAGMAYIAAALVTGLSGIGGGIAVAAGAPAAIGATSEDPKAFGKALIFVALGEGIALYGLLVSILILSKV